MTDFARTSAVDGVADRYVADLVVLNPLLATSLGVTEHNGTLPDLSPDGRAANDELTRRVLRDLDRAASADSGPLDATDRVTLAAMRERLGLEIERYDAGEVHREVNVVSSPVQMVREVFDLVPVATEQDWATVAQRLAAVPGALTGYAASLSLAAGNGQIAARRQVTKAAQQCLEFAAPNGFFATLAADARPDGTLPGSALSDALLRGATAARTAYAELGAFLLDRLAPDAPEDDAVGAERYELASRDFLGTTVDQVETYAWGRDELRRIEVEMDAVADRIAPGQGLRAAITALESDPARRIVGKEAFRDWMQDLSDRTVEELGRTHFDIPEPVRKLDCRISPSTTGVIYYTPPSEDFTRPGAMWWAVPAGVTSFSTWKEVSTVFHEGVPGHHLQCGQTAYRSDQLNRWRRSLCWVSGHGEGWALYAERLMGELGYLEEPGAHLGMLDGQALRAARVVVDIGLHLRLDAPAEVGGGTWDAAKAWQFLRAHVRIDDATLRFELDRYLGWPGQAPSYKIGERSWLELRAEVARRDGAGFDLRAFHRRALDLGSLGLDALREAVLTA